MWGPSGVPRFFNLYIIMMDFITNNLSDIIGYTGSICLILGYMPQAIYTIRTHDTDGIALPTFLMMGLGGILFAIQGLMLENWPLFITNVITTVSSAIVFGIKMYNDYFKKEKAKTTSEFLKACPIWVTFIKRYS